MSSTLTRTCFATSSGFIELVLSRCAIFLTLKPCASIINFVHSIFAIASSMPTNSDSVELLVFTFCFIEMDVTVPLPRVMIAPV
eukprot:scaffold34650_cov50-Attheya_sp.AAC.3